MKHMTALAFFAAMFLTTAAQAQSADNDALIARGSYLSEGIAACGNCHAVRERGQIVPEKGLSGGQVIEDDAFTAIAPNITPDPETGIGRWTAAELRRALREGIRPDGTLIGPPMPIEFLRSVSDADLAAIIAWLRAQPPIKNQVAKSTYKMPLPRSYGPPIASVSAPPQSDPVRYGAYLAEMGHCMECHTPFGSGPSDTAHVGAGGRAYKGPWGVSVSRNLTPHESGLKNWSDAEIVRAIQQGVSRDGTRLRPPMGFEFYARVNASDMAALVAYLRTLPAQPFGGRP